MPSRRSVSDLEQPDRAQQLCDGDERQTDDRGVIFALDARKELDPGVLKDGDVLRWSWLLPPYFSHSRARALDPTDAIFIYGTPLLEEFASDHDLGYELLKRLAQARTRRCTTRGWRFGAK